MSGTFDSYDLEGVERKLTELIQSNKKLMGGTAYAQQQIVAIAEKQLQELQIIRQKAVHQEKLDRLRTNLAKRQAQIESRQIW